MSSAFGLSSTTYYKQPNVGYHLLLRPKAEDTIFGIWLKIIKRVDVALGWWIWSVLFLNVFRTYTKNPAFCLVALAARRTINNSQVWAISYC